MNIAFTVLRAMIFRICLYFSLLSSSDLSLFLPFGFSRQGFFGCPATYSVTRPCTQIRLPLPLLGLKGSPPHLVQTFIFYAA